MNSDSKTVRGLSIAIVVLTALSILAIIAGFACVAILGVAANDPMVIAEIQNELGDAPYSSGGYFDDDFVYMNGGDAITMMNLIVGVGAVALLLCLACSAVQLVAGIMGIRHCANPAKFSKLFGWSIAGIVVSVLTGSLISLVLFIIVTVYVNKMRKLPPEAFATQAGYAGAQPYTYASQGYYQAQQPSYYGQPYGAQPLYDQQPQGTPYPYGQPGQNAPRSPYGQRESAASQQAQGSAGAGQSQDVASAGQPVQGQQPPHDSAQNDR